MNSKKQKVAYEAIAQLGNKDAGFICFGTTKESCREMARHLTSMAIKVRRVLISEDHLAMLKGETK